MSRGCEPQGKGGVAAICCQSGSRLCLPTVQWRVTGLLSTVVWYSVTSDCLHVCFGDMNPALEPCSLLWILHPSVKLCFVAALCPVPTALSQVCCLRALRPDYLKFHQPNPPPYPAASGQGLSYSRQCRRRVWANVLWIYKIQN